MHFFFFFNYLFRASQLWLKLNGNDLICDQSSLTSLVNCGCLQHLLQYKQTFQICCNKASNNAFFSFLAGDIIFNARYPELPPDFIFGEDAEFLPEPSELPVSRMEECEMFNRGKGFFYIYNFLYHHICSTPQHAFAKSTSDSFLLILHVKYRTHFLQMVDGHNLIDWSGQERFSS